MYIIKIIFKNYLELEKMKGLINTDIINEKRKKIKFINNDLMKLFDYLSYYNIKYNKISIINKNKYIS